MTFLLASTLLQNLRLAVQGIHPSSSTAEVARYVYMSFHPTPWNVLIRQFCHLLLITSIRHFKTTVKGFYSTLSFPTPCQAHRNITDRMQGPVGTQSNFTSAPVPEEANLTSTPASESGGSGNARNQRIQGWGRAGHLTGEPDTTTCMSGASRRGCGHAGGL